jgi:hypothetical protein
VRPPRRGGSYSHILDSKYEQALRAYSESLGAGAVLLNRRRWAMELRWMLPEEEYLDAVQRSLAREAAERR